MTTGLSMRRLCGKEIQMIGSFFAPNGFDIDNGILWFVPYSDRLLCGYSIREKKITCVKIIPEEIENPALIRNVLVSENKVYLIPSIINHIHVYDIGKDKFESVLIEINNNQMNFYAAHIYKDNLFIFPAKNIFILKIDLKNYNVEKIKILDENVEDKDQDLYFTFSNCRKSNNIILLRKTAKSICIFDMETMCFEYREIEKSEGYYGTVTSISDDEIALTDDCGNITVYNLNNNNVENIMNDVQDFNSKEFYSSLPCFSTVIYHNTALYMFPATGNMILEMDMDKKIIRKSMWIKHISSEFNNQDVQMFSEIKIYKDNGYGFLIKKGILTKVEFDKHTIIELPLQFDGLCTMILKQYARCELEKHPIREGKTIIGNIQNLIDYLIEER